MNDPFNSLRGVSPRVSPDDRFVDSVMRVVQQRLDSSSVSPYDDTDLTDLEVVPMNAHPPKRTWWLVAAAVVLLLASIFAITALRDDDGKLEPAEPSTSTTTEATSMDMNPLLATIKPVVAGTYSLDPDGDPETSLRVVYDLPHGWSSWFGGVNLPATEILSITTMTNVVRDACTDHSELDPPVGPTVDDLVTALTALTPFEVSEPPRDVTMAGYQGTYFEHRIPDDIATSGTGGDFPDCVDRELHSWLAPLNGGEPFRGYDGVAGAFEEFWILDVEGTRLVIVALSSPDTSEADVLEMMAIIDSIQIQP